MTILLPDLLRNLLREHGQQLTYDIRLLQALLSDYSVDKGQIRFALHAVEQGLAGQLWQLQGKQLSNAAYHRMIKQLEDKCGLKPDAAWLALSGWTKALEIDVEIEERVDQWELLDFINHLLIEKDPQFSPEQLAQARESLLVELNDQINARLVSCLSDKDQDTLSELIDSDASDEDIDEFFVATIPNLEIEIASVLIDFRNAYLMDLRDAYAELSLDNLENNPDIANSSTRDGTELSLQRNFTYNKEQRHTTVGTILKLFAFPLLLLAALATVRGTEASMVAGLILIAIVVVTTLGRLESIRAQAFRQIVEGKAGIAVRLVQLHALTSFFIAISGTVVLFQMYDWMVSAGFLVAFIGYYAGVVSTRGE